MIYQTLNFKEIGKMHPYPLYDSLIKQVQSNQGHNIEIKRICNTINMLSQTSDQAPEIYREIAMLIIYHAGLHNEGPLYDSKESVPYSGKVMVGGKGILITISNLPPLLQQIIAQFIENLAG